MRGRILRTFRSRELRANSTDAETKLWNHIRNRQVAGCKFVRQEPVGHYICDFVCRDRCLVIEVDGGQHLESKRDEIRDRYLTEQGYRVLRFWNNDVLSNIDGVLTEIQHALASTPTPDGVLIDDATWNKRKGEWLPSTDDGDFIASLMTPVTETGVYASWISPPKVGIDNKPGDFEYVKIET